MTKRLGNHFFNGQHQDALGLTFSWLVMYGQSPADCTDWLGLVTA
jgi:hypothetical protein